MSSLFMTHLISVMHALVKFHEYWGCGGSRSCGPDTFYYMQLRQGKIIQNQKMQELSSLFMTNHLIVMDTPVKFHEYIPCFGVMARTRKWDGLTDGRTDVRDGQG